MVPLLISIAAFGNGNSSQLAMWLGIAAVKIVVALTVLLFIGQKFMTCWFDLIARRRSQELFMLNLLLVTLGAAFMTDKFSLSLALGALIAGMLIAKTPYRHQVEEDIKPFRDVLLGLFFITTGMLLNPRIIWEHPFLVLGFFIVPILLKAVMITALARAFGSPQGVAMRTGLGLAQAGEFGFVLLNLILDSHLVDSVILQAIHSVDDSRSTIRSAFWMMNGAASIESSMAERIPLRRIAPQANGFFRALRMHDRADPVAHARHGALAQHDFDRAFRDPARFLSVR